MKNLVVLLCKNKKLALKSYRMIAYLNNESNLFHKDEVSKLNEFVEDERGLWIGKHLNQFNFKIIKEYGSEIIISVRVHEIEVCEIIRDLRFKNVAYFKWKSFEHKCEYIFLLNKTTNGFYKYLKSKNVYITEGFVKKIKIIIDKALESC